MKLDAKLIAYVLLDGFGKANDVCPSGTSMVDKDKGLQGINSGRAETLTFPSALVNKPARGKFDARWGRVVRHIRIEGLKFFEGFLRNDGIHKETACAAYFGRFGQFCSAHFNDDSP